MKDSPATDNNDLASFGYRQELKRSMGSFSSFAAGFSYISILTGLFQMFHLEKTGKYRNVRKASSKT